MHIGRMTLACTLLLAGAASAPAQTAAGKLSSLQIGIACAPPPVLAARAPDAIRVLGGQDSEGRSVLGERDKVVLNAGASRGLAVGQQYFVRRLLVDPEEYGRKTFPESTLGWLTIVAVNDTTAIGAVDNTCGPIQTDDFIEPFVRPDPPAGVDIVVQSGQLDFSSLGKVLYGNAKHNNLTVGDFMLIDQGADRGMTEGAHVAVYRDPGKNSLPLVAIGEAGIVTVGPTMSLARLNQVHAEIRTGDYIVPKR
jgi:hypothetical protein